MDPIDAKLDQVLALTQSARADAYIELVRECVGNRDSNGLQKVIESAVDESPVVARRVLQGASGLANTQDALQVLVDTIPGTGFEDEAIHVRGELSKMQEEGGHWAAAASTLAGMPLERCNDNEERLRIYMRIVRLYLDSDDIPSAELHLGRAAQHVHQSTNTEMQAAYTLALARIHDYHRRFPDAAIRYHQLSLSPHVPESERLPLLVSAINCAVLSPAGPQRSRILAALHRDDRAPQLPSYPILSSVFLDRIISPHDLHAFLPSLRPHHLAHLPSPSSASFSHTAEDDMLTDDDRPHTVLDQSVMEHNLLAVSRIYNNISFSSLASILSLSPSAAEVMARNMIVQRRLRGSIDQIDELITFDPKAKELDSFVSNVALATGEHDDIEDIIDAPEITRWDTNLRNTSLHLEELAQRCSRLIAQH